MKKSLLLLLLISVTAYSQIPQRQTLSMSGNITSANIGSKRYVLFQSVGQLSVIQTFDASEKSLRQGFIQPLGPAALEDSDLELSLVLYPNPFVNSLTIDFEEEIIEPISISLYDMLGRQVLSLEYDIAQSLNVPLNTISTGGYLISIQSGTRKNVKQIVKF